MRELENIKHFDEYVSVLNEDLIHGDQKVLNRAFANGGPIKMPDGKEVSPREIIKVVNDAIMWLRSEYLKTFSFADRTLSIIYLAHSSKYKTMAVDGHMNLYLNAEFVYTVLKMDPSLIAAVLMHEVLHALFNHLERGQNWLAAQGKGITKASWHDTNLAADVEVNRTLVRMDVIDADRLVNEIKGLYLPKRDGGRDTVMMETILENEEYMNKLRAMAPPPVDPSKQPPQPETEVQTTDEWNKGYKDAWNKIAGLINKYGHKGALQKLMDAGIVNAVGEIYTDHETDEIMGLEYLTVKSFEDYINEDLSVEKDEYGKTYKDGFMNAFGKLVNKLYNTVNPPEGQGGGGTQKGGQKLKSDLPEDELEPIEFPGQKGDGDEDEEEPGVPEPIMSDSEDDKDGDNEKQKKSKQGGKGSKGKSSDELTDDDINKLANDIEKKTNGGQEKISTQQEVSYGGIGGTGSFEEDGLSDDELREAGYSDEDIKEINKVRDTNKTKNSKEGLKKNIEWTKRELAKEHNPICNILDKIEVESRKYMNIWKDILKEFMAKNTRRAGKDVANGSNDWKNKKSIARGEYGIHHQNTAQDPQDVNIYVDVSGSMDMELLEIIAKSLVVFTQQWKYSGINVCPWASTSNGVHKIDNFYKKSEPVIIKEILEIISAGYAECGGGTSAHAAINAMIDCIDENLNDPKKKKKDDIHVVITDGQFDFNNIEDKITGAIKSFIGRDDVAEKAPDHTVWMIYDADEGFKAEWESEIKKGRTIFINSKVVKNNK